MDSNNNFQRIVLDSNALRPSGICVIKKSGESIESLMKRFKKKYVKSGIINEIKERTHYEKPSAKRRKKVIMAKRRQRIALESEKENNKLTGGK